MNANSLLTGSIIRSRRRRMGWTQKRLAEELDCSFHTVRAWERDQRKAPHYVDLAMRYLRAKAKAEREREEMAS